MRLLWEEHRAAHPEGYGCELFRAWEGRLSPTMRQSHVAGEKLFVDYAGTTLDVIDGTTGEVLNAQLFVAACAAKFKGGPAKMAFTGRWASSRRVAAMLFPAQ
jgi:transposase